MSSPLRAGYSRAEYCERFISEKVIFTVKQLRQRNDDRNCCLPLEIRGDLYCYCDAVMPVGM